MITLVLLPGLDGTGMLFEPFVTALGSGCPVKIVRYPPDQPLAYAELQDVARAALPQDGPFVILGESFSGPIAVSLAASCPAQLKGLVLCCSFVRNPYPFTKILKPLVGLLPITSRSASVSRNFQLGRFATDALRSKLAEAIAGVSPAVIRARLREVIDVDVSARLATIGVPLLYLRASHDRLISRASSEIVSRLKPETRVIQFEAPHFLLQTVPAEAAKIVSAFVREVDDIENNLQKGKRTE